MGGGGGVERRREGRKVADVRSRVGVFARQFADSNYRRCLLWKWLVCAGLLVNNAGGKEERSRAKESACDDYDKLQRVHVRVATGFTSSAWSRKTGSHERVLNHTITFACARDGVTEVTSLAQSATHGMIVTSHPGQVFEMHSSAR